MDRDTPTRTEELLAAHVEWVRALARRLADDDASAEDLAQDALVVALSSGPRESLKFRPWMAAVMRNLVRQEARGTSRREMREERAARPEVGDRLVDEVVAGRELAQSVLDLPEPYRTAILLRFFENAPPREIADRLEVPVATVNSRLARGLAQLRQRYDRGGKDRVAALAPLLAPIHAPAGPALPALSLGGLVLNAKFVLSVAVAAILAVALWGIAATRGTSAGAGASLAEPASPVAATSREAPAIRLDEATGASGRAASASSASQARPALAAATAESTRTVAGTLLDADGLPLAGLAVGVGATSARANGAGRFAFETTADSVPLTVLDAGWVTVREGVWRASATIEPVVVTAREIGVAGLVVDARGEPIQDARVQFVLPHEFGTRFPTSLESSKAREFGATSDARGRFDLGGVPSIAGARIRALREGWSAAEVELPPGPDAGLRIVMARPAIPLSGAVHGVVVDDRGDPVAEARVFLGLASTTTDERGRFGIELARAVTADRIVAVKSGRLPALLERPREPRGEDTGWPDEIQLVLGGTPLAIRGVVRDHEGHPQPGVRISIADPSAIGTIGRMPATAEGFASGAELPPLALEPDPRAPKQDDEHHHSMGMRVGPPTAFWNYVVSDADGRFSIGGLADRRYKLRLTDTRTRQAHTTDPIQAGEPSADVRMPAPRLWPELRGIVVDDSGDPVAGVSVRSSNEAYGVRARIFGGEISVSLKDYGDKTVTGEDGRFVLRDVPREGTVLDFTSERTVPRDLELGSAIDAAQLEVEVALRCSFELRVATGPGPQPDGFTLLDGRGDVLEILIVEPSHVRSYSRGTLSGGRSGVLSASSAARTLVLFLDGTELRRVPVRLRAGESNVLDV